ncbi:MAG: Hpt domain-containing protein [Nitrospira sp.]|jgi:HPt (histidine-containing phosphotransfer) domain-containing protein|nr:Hpt domain-containing protein [Nitrospira sp.]MBP6605234.1 Hpt domain-containing protein [Nitrospira sp.]MCI1278065.1 Hpt domain-containing protein [Nitrospira sp.]HQY57178.1 Hpt domain-containing protein [Nitrospira sp.]HRA96048.1 Hpt domain-containing protein [Nitrospira sp.]
MSDSTPASSDLGSGPIIVHVDASFEPLIPKFMANRKKELTTMTAAVDQGDFETVRKVAHGMKGVSGSYGFQAMTVIATRLEQAAKTTDEQSIRTDLPVLGSYLERVEIVYEE